MSWIDHNDIIDKLGGGHYKILQAADPLPHLHELVDDKASDLDGQQ